MAPVAVSLSLRRRKVVGDGYRLSSDLPALESSHTLSRAMELAAARKPDDMVVVCLSGRGDKDAAEIARLRGLEF